MNTQANAAFQRSPNLLHAVLKQPAGLALLLLLLYFSGHGATLYVSSLSTFLAMNPPPVLTAGKVSIQLSDGKPVLTWAGNFILQTATEPGGPYSDVPEASSRFINELMNVDTAFFRLRN